MSVKVGIIMGSDSDLPVMSKAAEILDEFRPVGNIVKIVIFRQRRKLPFQREIPVSFAVFSDIGTDIVRILQV